MPYQGTGPAMTDLVGGQVDFMCDQTTNTTEPDQGRAIKGYAITSPERNPALPDLPTTAEGGLADLERQHLARPLRAEGHAGRGRRRSSTRR